MPYLTRFCIVFIIVLLLAGCDNESPGLEDKSLLSSEPLKSRDNATVDRAELMAFQPAGNFGGGVLVPGTFSPPTNGGFSILHCFDPQLAIHKP